MPSVCTLHHHHSLIVSKLRVKLTVSNVNRNYPTRTSLEQAVGEPAG
jgi:hypothetical protein